MKHIYNPFSKTLQIIPNKVADITNAEDVSNKDTTTTLGTSDTKYPSQNAVKTYVDSLLPKRFTLWPDEFTLAAGAGVITLWNNIVQQCHDFCSYQVPSANADSFEATFVCAAKTYSVTILYMKFSGGGIIDFTIDGNAVATGVDMYAAGLTYNQKSTFSVALAAGEHTFKWTANGKNAASTQYYAQITKVTFK